MDFSQPRQKLDVRFDDYWKHKWHALVIHIHNNVQTTHAHYIDTNENNYTCKSTIIVVNERLSIFPNYETNFKDPTLMIINNV